MTEHGMRPERPSLYVVMGVCGSGKTTLGQALATAIGASFLEGDDFHSPANVEKMRSGIPLTDEDRQPWLLGLGQSLRAASQRGEGVVLACSALKFAYREQLRRDAEAPLQFVYLKATRELITQYMAERQDHFMPSSLIESQFAVLEEPDTTEALHVEASWPPDRQVAAVLKG